MAKYAFYIVSGPWGRLWCRFGFDPRLDSSAKQYQTVMVSFRRHQNIPERNRLRVSLGGGSSTSAASKEFPQILDYIYKPGKYKLFFDYYISRDIYFLIYLQWNVYIKEDACSFCYIC